MPSPADPLPPRMGELLHALREWTLCAGELVRLCEEQVSLVAGDAGGPEMDSLLVEKERLYRSAQACSEQVESLMDGLPRRHPADLHWDAKREEADRMRAGLLARLTELSALEERSRQAVKERMAGIQGEMAQLRAGRTLARAYGSPAAASGDPCFLDHRR